MAKQRQKPLLARPASKINAPKRDLTEEDSWVIVKKQRVTILIPPLPTAKQSTSPNPKSETLPNLQEKSMSLASKVNIQLDSPVQVKSFVTSNTLLSQSKLLNGSMISLDRCALLDRKFRAVNLERKIQSVGGLNEWLASLGLGKFVRKFEKNNVRKFQMVGLTMKKLKDMGVDPVGPRRKIIHAIECISQPYCFKSI